MNRHVTNLLVAIVTTLSGAATASAQGISVHCPQLVTLEKTRQQIEALRQDREAGINRLPAKYQREALDSLYRWYWPRLARLEAQQAQIEASCRAALTRQDESLTRESPRYHVYGPFRIPEVMYPRTDPWAEAPAYRQSPTYPANRAVPRPAVPSPGYPQTRVYQPYRSPGGGVYAPNSGAPGTGDPFSWPR